MNAARLVTASAILLLTGCASLPAPRPHEDPARPRRAAGTIDAALAAPTIAFTLPTFRSLGRCGTVDTLLCGPVVAWRLWRRAQAPIWRDSLQALDRAMRPSSSADSFATYARLLAKMRQQAAPAVIDSSFGIRGSQVELTLLGVSGGFVHVTTRAGLRWSCASPVKAIP